MVINQHQLRAHAFIEQGGALLTIACRPHLAAPARQQALHANQDAVFIIDTQHPRPCQWLTILLGNHWLRRGLALRHRHADAEYAAKAGP